MTANLTIVISVICAALAGLGMYAAHAAATKWHWRFLHRYTVGVVIANTAFAVVLFARMAQGIETWNLYNSLGWFKFQRTNQGDVVDVAEQPRQLTSGRNVPQPISAADLPPFDGAPDF